MSKDKMQTSPFECPAWFDGKSINEVLFCQHFLHFHPMKCVRGRLFTIDGMVEDEGEISQIILDEVRGHLTSGIAKAVSNLMASLKLMAYSPPLPVETDRIHSPSTKDRRSVALKRTTSARRSSMPAIRISTLAAAI